MVDQKLLVTHPSCGHCAELKENETIKAKIASGEIELAPVTEANGYAVYKALGLDEVPACVTRKEDGTFERCKLEDLMK